MFAFHRVVVAAASSAIVLLTACSSPGLPPAGPAPGEVDTGHGTQKEEKITGSVTSLDEEKLGGDRPVQWMELLRGRVAGLEFVKNGNGPPSIRIRGISSVNNQPYALIVVDGIPMNTTDLDNALAGLTYRDIRQVDVLKDVSSTAIYGLRGAGGVIVINTRR